MSFLTQLNDNEIKLIISDCSVALQKFNRYPSYENASMQLIRLYLKANREELTRRQQAGLPEPAASPVQC